jgi:2-aminophenol/2-amino-5-chlorophenol 1,6-dioxygenase alpha subunit
MTLVASFLVTGHPLPVLAADVPAYATLRSGLAAAADALAASRADVVLAYSTQWFAVLDELWQTRPRLQGLHVDENWYDRGDLPFDITVDTALAQACIEASPGVGVKAKAVDYDGFPIDSGTIVMANGLDPQHRLRYVLASNNLYHDAATTEKLAAMAVEVAAGLGRRVALVGVGGLSGTLFRQKIDLAEDHVAGAEDDALNRRLLSLLEKGDADALRTFLPEYAGAAKADMGMKHLHWLLGGMGDRWTGAKVLGYGPGYGTGQAVVQFQLRH